MSSPAEVKSEIRQLMIETPSWAYGNSGTRFKVFPQKGVARTPQEKLEDAAQVNKFNRCRTVSCHSHPVGPR